ncbi:hypothetical protein BRC82_09805 [Halobacteriales archaeon QS_1_67_19]|nr:MAG: hypothetical protein BRC82_09805 [Halobacteriales archaeon QS_1_67_19]
MRSRVVLTVVVLVSLSGIAPLGASGLAAPNAQSTAATGPAAIADHAGDRVDATDTQYEVSLENVTIQTWILRNATVRNATIQEVVIENATTEDGVRENVTLSNVTVGSFLLERAEFQNVTADMLVIRNKSVLDVPGGDFVDPDVDGRTIERHQTQNATVAGVVIDRISVDAAILCENASLGEEAEDTARFDPQTDEDDPAVTVEGGEVGQALVIRGEASNWSVGSIDQPDPDDATLPEGCDTDNDGE